MSSIGEGEPGSGGLVYVLTSVLRPAEWNPRVVMTDEFRRLCEMIRADPSFLIARPVLAMDNGVIYAGAQRYRAVCQLYREGWSTPLWETGHIPAILHDITEQQAKTRALRDNVHAGHWQEIELAEILTDLAEHSLIDVRTTGFSDEEVRNTLAAAGIGSPVHPVSGRTLEPEDSAPASLQGANGETLPGVQTGDGEPLTIVLRFENAVAWDNARWMLRSEQDWMIGYIELRTYDEQGRRTEGL